MWGGEETEDRGSGRRDAPAEQRQGLFIPISKGSSQMPRREWTLEM